MTTPGNSPNRTRLTSCFPPNSSQSVSGSNQTPPVAYPVHDRAQFVLNSKPTKSSRGRWIEVSRRFSCNICGRTEGFCKFEQQAGHWFCSQVVDSIRVSAVVTALDGGRWARIGGRSDWAVFKPDEAFDRTARPVTLTPKSKPSVTPLLGVEQRHAAFSRLLALLALSAADHADLTRRGFTADQIKAAGFCSIQNGFRLPDAPAHLPGFSGNRYSGQSGYLLPIRTIDGLVVGFQTRSANGYRWASVDGNYRLPIDEPPLVFLSGTTSQIFLAEGTGAKPAFINQTTGAMVIGASGGRWNGSPKQIAELIQRFPDATFTLLPDAGCIQNPRITANYQATAALFGQHGVELGFQWWNQLEKGTDPDADETAFWTDGIRLLSTEFFSDEFRQTCEEKILVRRAHQLTRQPTTTSEGVYLPAGSIPIDKPMVALHAPMGSGKTEVMVNHINNSSRRTIAACHRRNLSRNFSARTKTIPHRQDGELFCPISGDSLITGVPAAGDSSCIDSWHRGSSVKRTPEDFEGSTFVMDEADQGVDHLLRGKTCKQFRGDIIDTFRDGLPLAEQTIIASGTLDDITVDLYEAATGHTVHLHRHISTADRWSHSFLNSETHALGQIVQAVEAGQNILISTSDAGDENKFSRIGAHILLAYLRNHCPDLNETNSDAFSSSSIAAGATDSRQKLFMRDPVSAVRGLRVAIYSPVAETGVDINLRGHFNSVFVLSSGFTMTPQAVVQAACRLRDPNAHRFFWAPNSSPRQKGHGITDPQELITTILEDAAYNEARFSLNSIYASLTRNDLKPSEDPFLQAWAKLEIRAELDNKHYRFVIKSLLKDFGSEQKQASVVTKLDKNTAKDVRQFTNQKKTDAAIAVITAPLPGTPEFDAAPRELKDAGRRRQKIEITTGKTLSPKNTSGKEILQTIKAIGPLKQRFLLQHPELAITIDNEARKNISSWIPDVASINTANRIEALIEMGARNLLQPGAVWSSANPEIQQLNAYLGQHSSRLRRWFGGKPKKYADPIRALDWLVKVVGMKTAPLEKTRINGQQVTPQQIQESHNEVNVDAIFAHWRQNPAIVTGTTAKREPLLRLEPVPNSLVIYRENGDLGTTVPFSGVDSCISPIVTGIKPQSGQLQNPLLRLEPVPNSLISNRDNSDLGTTVPSSGDIQISLLLAA